MYRGFVSRFCIAVETHSHCTLSYNEISEAIRSIQKNAKIHGISWLSFCRILIRLLTVMIVFLKEQLFSTCEARHKEGLFLVPSVGSLENVFLRTWKTFCRDFLDSCLRSVDTVSLSFILDQLICSNI